MTQPAARGDDGIYRHPETGEEFPSYSSIAGMKAKPAIAYWAANRVAHAAVYDPGEISRQQSKLLFEAFENDGDLDLREAKYHALRGYPWRERDTAADLGNEVHAAIERYQQDDLPGVYTDEVEPFMRQFERFLGDYKPHIFANEVTVFNRTINYAGTLDILATLPGDKGICIIDIKSGKSVYEDAAIQQNAYANGEVYWDSWEHKDISLPPIDKAYILHVRPKSYKLIPVTLSQENFDVFVNLREVWAWEKTHKKTALGKAV